MCDSSALMSVSSGRQHVDDVFSSFNNQSWIKKKEKKTNKQLIKTGKFWCRHLNIEERIKNNIFNILFYFKKTKNVANTHTHTHTKLHCMKKML